MINLFQKIGNKLFYLIFKQSSVYYKGIKKYDLLIFDDIFPHPMSGFRHEEFIQLLKKFKKAKIVTSGNAYSIVNSTKKDYKNHLIQIKNQYPELEIYPYRKSSFININTKLFYCVFVNNISENLFWLEKYKIPFVFTLYPGGGFKVNNEISDEKLKRVLSSPQFRKVIVTQKFTLNYLIDNNFCQQDSIEFIFGGVVPQISFQCGLGNKYTYLKNKPTLDICFCGAKYMPKGKDKGYDVFIELAHRLNKKYNFIRFHVIGGFDENEIDVKELKDAIKFYGYQNFENLKKIFQNMDIIISPNRPFFLDKGSFDGFPLGTVVEAVLNGVVAMITDELQQNVIFENKKEIIIIESNSEHIEKEILNLIDNPNKLYQISDEGRNKFEKVYSNQVQMIERIKLLQKEINV